ncbi:hypothetical protein C0993_001706 [Termitomyces sp. T159_Od127]|nr:hypothetical protein C0993_001706 [Termitomyces sp. T159_Od127]
MDYHYSSYINSNPSSTHSSPQSYAQELDVAYHPYPPPSHLYSTRRPLPIKSASGPLHVSTNTSHEQDPNERTARPGNSHHHTQFHAETMPLLSQPLPVTSMDQDPPAQEPIRHSFNYTSSTPGLSARLSRPLNTQEQERLMQLDQLKFFLATAPSRWAASSDADQHNTANPLNGQSLPNYPSSNGLAMHQGGPDGQNTPHPPLHRFTLPSGESVSCVLWNGLYHITGTDIVRALVFRFEAFGRPVRNMKKFEEGVFSDLRNLKPGVDACLEEPKSPFLDLLFKYQCIRTQKKQKVFYWFSVPHDRLFLDALERDLKREKMGQEPTTVIVGEPAISFTYDPKKTLYEQFSKAQGVREGEGELESAVRMIEETSRMNPLVPGEDQRSGDLSVTDESDASASDADEVMADSDHGSSAALQAIGIGSSWLGGSSEYKVRKKGPKRENEKRGRSLLLGDTNKRYESLSRERDCADAAEMFMRQANREFSSADRKPSVASYLNAAGQAQPQGYVTIEAGHQRPGIQDRHHRHTVPLLSPPATTASVLSGGFTSFAQQQDASEGVQMTKSKAFVCPLFSCGRMFKRMEHLKRHLRTHTMERPYACPQCNKKFSRSDNLNQHLRTHGRGHSGPVGAGATFGLGVDSWIDNSGDDADSGGSPDGRSTSVGREHDDSDYDDGLMYGGSSLMPDFDRGLLAGSTGLTYGADIDPQSCMVEVSGELPDMSGDEDGMLGNQGFYMPGPNGLGLQHQQDGFDANWGLRAQPSPAFSNASNSSPPPGALGHVRNNSNRNSLTGAYRTHSSSSSASGSSVFGGEELGTSMSAPSHKQTFDHAALYPQGLVDAPGSAAGPIRRYRSMTPSASRSAESIRRPGTANGTSGEFPGDSPGSSAGLNNNIGGRGYHPYAAYGASGSRPTSTHSSPSTYPVPLPGEYTGHGHPGARRSESRNSNLGGTMMQMMNMSMESGSPGAVAAAAAGQQQQGAAAAFQRTGSPFMTTTESPAPFTSELPPVQAQFGARAAAAAAAFGLGDPMQEQSGFVMQGIEDDSTYFSHSQHATL